MTNGVLDVEFCDFLLVDIIEFLNDLHERGQEVKPFSVIQMFVTSPTK